MIKFNIEKWLNPMVKKTSTMTKRTSRQWSDNKDNKKLTGKKGLGKNEY